MFIMAFLLFVCLTRKKTMLRSPVDFALRLLSMILLALYTLCISQAFSPLNCDRQSDGSYILVKYPSMKCFDSSWFRYSGAIVLVFSTYVVIIPLLTIWIFVKNRKNLNDSRFQFKYGFLISPYKREYFYWELVNILKRVIFLAISDLMHLDYAERFSSFAVVLGFFTFIEAYLQPFRSVQIMWVSAAWNLVSLLVLISQGLVFEDGVGDVITGGFVVFVVTSTAFICCVHAFSEVVHRGGVVTIPMKAVKAFHQSTLERIYILRVIDLLNKNGDIELDLTRKNISVQQKAEIIEASQPTNNPSTKQWEALETFLAE
eukprot:TRINITY_DN6185_c0_g1_i3.p1 TRINITY_DN6185_c0_g1~~TRINITY_DN6185_c0_g1_i3.p1  ORF type:complete len:317 (-),score=71.97 TRINITY_DN6185_c0_g1_i3:4-954(-)